MMYRIFKNLYRERLTENVGRPAVFQSEANVGELKVTLKVGIFKEGKCVTQQFSLERLSPGY